MIKIEYEGEIPSITQFALAAADHKYYEKFAPAFVESADACDQKIHLGVVNPIDSTRELMNRIKDVYNVDTTIMHVDFKHYTHEQKRVFYACARSHLAAWLGPKDIFILDIDSVFNRPYPFHPGDKPVSLFLRDAAAAGARTMTELRGMKCLGCFAIKPSAYEYIQEVSDRMQEEDHGYWFLDQICIIEAANDLNIPITDLSGRDVIDWQFDDTRCVTSQGKGDRKYNNAKYLAIVKVHEDAAREKLFEVP